MMGNMLGKRCHLFFRKLLAATVVLFSISPIALAKTPATLQLLDAALTGDVAGMEQALAMGAALEARDDRLDLTPLMLAIYRDHGAAIRYLVEHQANINARNPRGQTPLMMLASGGQTELVKFLLESGARRNARDELGNTALMWAAYWGHEAVIDVLLQPTSAQDLSPELNLQNEEGNTIMHLAATGGLANQTRRLLQKPEYGPTGRRLPTLLRGTDQLNLMKKLRAAGAPLDLPNQAGQTPLLLMAEKGFWDPVHWLLEQGANPRQQDKAGAGLLDYAKRSGNRAFVRRLQQRL